MAKVYASVCVCYEVIGEDISTQEIALIYSHHLVDSALKRLAMVAPHVVRAEAFDADQSAAQEELTVLDAADAFPQGTQQELRR